MKKLLLCCALTFFPLLLPSLAAAESSAQRGATEQALAQAQSLLHSGKFQQAYELYMTLLRAHPDNDVVQLGLARAATHSKHWNQAVMAYEILLEKYAGEAALYGELAHVYMMLGQREAAERTLAVMQTLGGKQGNTVSLADMERKYSQLQVHGKVRTGVLYNSNVNMGPDSERVTLQNWSVTVPEAKRKESFGTYAGADLDLGWRMQRDGDWWLVGSAKAQWTGYENPKLNQQRTRESHWGSASAGLRRLTSGSLLDVRMRAEVFDYDWYQNVAAAGPEITWVWAVHPSVHLISRGNVDRRSYSQSKGHDGIYWSVGEFVRLFFGQANHEFMVGATVVGSQTDNGIHPPGNPQSDRRDYSYHGWEGYAKMTFKLPKGFEFSPFVGFAQSWYNDPGTSLETAYRQDDKWRAGASLVWNINDSWAIESAYQMIANQSNSNLYDYTQHYMSVGVSWSF